MIMLFTAFTVQSQSVKFWNASGAKKVMGYYKDGGYGYGHGVCFADITGDQLPDILVSNAVRDAYKLPELLYISHAGDKYSEEAKLRNCDDPFGTTGSHGIVFVDIDNDGDYDIFNGTTDLRNRLYRNLGSGNFQEIGTDESGLERVNWGTRGVTAFDANNDGYMDLFAVNWYNSRITDEPNPNEFYLNNGDGTFTPVDNGLIHLNENNKGVQGVTSVDVENDGDMDVFIARRKYSLHADNQLMINDGNGNFTNKTDEYGLSYRKPLHYFNDCNGGHFADFDNDGDLDLFLANDTDGMRDHSLRIFENQGNGGFVDISDRYEIGHNGFSVLLFDVDNDTDLDLYLLSTRGTSIMFLNDGKGNFTHIANTGAEKYLVDPRAGAIADIDNDGDLDIYFVDANKTLDSEYYNCLFINNSQNDNRWIKIYGRGPAGDMGAFGTKIWVFKAGYLNDMNHLLGYKQIQSTYGYLSQDDPVQHFGLGKRDFCDVKIKLLDGTIFTYSNVPAETRLFFAKPRDMIKVSGDEQSGLVNQPLDEPLKVRVLDANDDGMANIDIKFRIVSGGGTFLQNNADTLVVKSDQDGYAEANLVLGEESFDQNVEVTSMAMPGVTLTFNCHILNLGPAILTWTGSTTRQGYVNQVLPDSIKVQVNNGLNQGQADHKVTFRVVGGNGTLYPGAGAQVDVYTNSQGYAAVAWKLGTSTFLMNELQISSEHENLPLINSPLMIYADSRPASAAQLLISAGNHQKGYIHEPLSDSLAVVVYDRYDNPVPNRGVRFQVQDGNGRVNNSTDISLLSDENGFVKVSWTLGEIAGIEQHLIAFLENNPSVSITFEAMSDNRNAARLLLMGDTKHSGNVNAVLSDSIAVRVEDQMGNPVNRYAVYFSSPMGGKINGNADIYILTNSQGEAKCEWQLGESTGEQRLHVSAGELTGSPVIIKADVRNKLPAFMRLLSQKSSLAYPNLLLEPLRVQITDSSNYPVVGHQVEFEIIEGEATFDGGKTINLLSDKYGKVQPPLNVGTKAGRILIQISSHYKGNPLIDSPEIVSIDLVGRTPQITQSTIQASSPHIANNKDLSNFIVTIRDQYQNPVPSIPLTIRCDNPNAAINQDQFVNNERGQITGEDKITKSDITHLWPERDGKPATRDSARIEFNPGKAFRLHKLTGDNQTGYLGQVLDSLLVFSLQDSFYNSIPNAFLKLKIQLPNGQVIDIEDGFSGTDGLFRYQWRLSKYDGLHRLIIERQGLEPIVFKAFAVKGVPAEVIKIEGDNQSGLTHTLLPKPFKVRVLDKNNIPLGQIPVNFHIINGGGKFIDGSVDTTNSLGEAQARYQLGDSPGSVLVRVVAEGLDIPVEFSSLVREATIREIKVVGGNNQFARVNTALPLPIEVQVLDELKRPVEGRKVVFMVSSGGGRIFTPDSVYSDENGMASCRWVLGEKGKQSLIVYLEGDKTIFAEFNAELAENTGPRIICPSDTVIFEMQRLLFTVVAIDAEADSCWIWADRIPPGATLHSDNIFQWQPDYSQAGMYQMFIFAQDILGAVTQKTIRIIVQEKNRLPVLQSFAPQDSMIVTHYGTTLQFEVMAHDLDGDEIRYQWLFNDMPVGSESAFSITPTTAYPASSSVKVRISDGKKSIEKQWFLQLLTSVSQTDQQPHFYHLEQNYPNPFNPSTTIRFALPESGHVELLIYNTFGQKIRTLVNQTFAAGTWTVSWNGCDDRGNRMPSGIYYYRLSTSDFTSQKKLIMIK